MNESMLKPCPFCGGKAEFHNCAELENEAARIIYNGKIGVHCTQCRIATLPFEDESVATSYWNRRVEVCRTNENTNEVRE